MKDKLPLFKIYFSPKVYSPHKLEKSIDYQTSSHFYAVSIKNDSIRLINAMKMAGLEPPKRITFLSERSPFLVIKS